MLTFALALRAEGLTLAEILSEIPHDAGAVVAYLMIAGMLFFTWYGSRRSVIERYSAPAPSVDARTQGGSEAVGVEELAPQAPRPAERPPFRPPVPAGVVGGQRAAGLPISAAALRLPLERSPVSGRCS